MSVSIFTLLYKIVMLRIEYLILKYNSRFVLPDAKRIKVNCANCLAFENKDESIVVVAFNCSAKTKNINFRFGSKALSAKVEACSSNTFYVE